MQKVVSATEARIHFGRLMHDVVETNQPVIVQRAGQPQVVVLPVGEFERLQKLKAQPQDEEALQFLESMAAIIEKRRQNISIPEPEELIRQMRKNRDEELHSHLR